jgi:hypothetical protein
MILSQGPGVDGVGSGTMSFAMIADFLIVEKFGYEILKEL